MGFGHSVGQITQIWRLAYLSSNFTTLNTGGIVWDWKGRKENWESPPRSGGGQPCWAVGYRLLWWRFNCGIVWCLIIRTITHDDCRLSECRHFIIRNTNAAIRPRWSKWYIFGDEISQRMQTALARPIVVLLGACSRWWKAYRALLEVARPYEPTCTITYSLGYTKSVRYALAVKHVSPCHCSTRLSVCAYRQGVSDWTAEAKVKKYVKTWQKSEKNRDIEIIMFTLYSSHVRSNF